MWGRMPTCLHVGILHYLLHPPNTKPALHISPLTLLIFHTVVCSSTIDCHLRTPLKLFGDFLIILSVVKNITAPQIIIHFADSGIHKVPEICVKKYIFFLLVAARLQQHSVQLPEK